VNYRGDKASPTQSINLYSPVGGTPVFGRRTDPVLRSACSRRVTSMWVNRPLQVSQLGQLTQPFILPRSIN